MYDKIYDSLSDYAKILKMQVKESLFKQNDHYNNLNEINPVTNSKNNEDLKPEPNENKQKFKDNGNSNILLNSSQTKIKTEFTSKIYKSEEQTIDNQSGFDPISLIILTASFYTFPKYGRIPNKLKNIKKGKHDNKAKDNSRSKLFTLCAKSLDEFIRNEFRKYDSYLHCLNIKSQLGTNLVENEKFFDKKIIDIYLDSRPKRHNDNNINYNKNQIKLVLKKEMDNDNIKIKLLNNVFNMEFKKIFKMYLYDIPYFILRKNNKDYKINLIGFKTYKYHLEDFDDVIKMQFKNNAKDFINGKISHRELRKKRNLSMDN